MENFISPLHFKKSNYVIRLFSNCYIIILIRFQPSECNISSRQVLFNLTKEAGLEPVLIYDPGPCLQKTRETDSETTATATRAASSKGFPTKVVFRKTIGEKEFDTVSA